MAIPIEGTPAIYQEYNRTIPASVLMFLLNSYYILEVPCFGFPFRSLRWSLGCIGFGVWARGLGCGVYSLGFRFERWRASGVTAFMEGLGVHLAF